MNHTYVGWRAMRSCLFFLLLSALALIPVMGQAEEYVEPSWSNVLRTMVRMNALDLSDNTLLDEYAIVTECALYKAFYRDDFKWREVHNALLKSVAMNVATFPTTYHHDVDLQLDRYDFNSRLYRLTAKTMLSNINTFVFYSVVGTACGQAEVKYMPRNFRAVLASPFYLDSIPLSQVDAQALLKQMEADGNTDHVVYARFNFRVVYIEPLRKEKSDIKDSTVHYKQSSVSILGDVRFDVRLESVNFYEDIDHTKLIYQFQP